MKRKEQLKANFQGEKHIEGRPFERRSEMNKKDKQDKLGMEIKDIMEEETF